MKTGEKLKFTVAVATISLFLALAAIHAKQGETLRVFAFTLITWTGYMTAHKIATGRFIDGKNPDEDEEKDEKMTPKDLTEDTGLIAGATLFITGMIIGGIGVQNTSTLQTFAGGLLFTTGYITAHWSTTGELL